MAGAAETKRYRGSLLGRAWRNFSTGGRPDDIASPLIHRVKFLNYYISINVFICLFFAPVNLYHGLKAPARLRGARYVIVLERGCIAVLELKGALNPSRAALDQAFGYARDLRAYHAACAGREVTPVLLVRGAGAISIERDGVHVVGPEGLDTLLARISAQGQPVVSAEEFLAPDAYAPLPTIVQAARELFHRRELPMIKRARAATDPALKYISEIAREAARTRTRHLVLLSGVPGSGKTLVGLQLVHSHWLDDLAMPRENGRVMSPAHSAGRSNTARSIGSRDLRIIFKHLLPNAIGPCIVAETLAIAGRSGLLLTGP